MKQKIRLNTDPGVIYLKKNDPTMNEIINHVGRYSIILKRDPYLGLIESIINQQLSGKAAQSIHEKFMGYFQTYSPTPESVVQTSVATMKSFGLSRMKIEYIRNLSYEIINGNLDLNIKSFLSKSDIDIKNYLTRVKGVGVWTADMFLIFCLGRPDIFPVSDIGIKKAIKRWYFPYSRNYPTDNRMVRLSQSWKPYRSIATWYLWKSISKFDTIG